MTTSTTTAATALPTASTPAEQILAEQRESARRAKANRLFPLKTIFLLIPAFLLAWGVDWMVRYLNDHRPMWVAIIGLFCLAASENRRSLRMQNLLTLEFTEKKQRIIDNAYRIVRSEEASWRENLQIEVQRLQGIVDEQRPSWHSIREWTDRIGFLTDQHGVPVLVNRPSALVVAKFGEKEPLLYFVNENGGYIGGHQIRVELSRVNLVKNPHHRMEDFLLSDTPMTHEGWVFASAKVTDFGMALRLLDKVSAQKS